MICDPLALTSEQYDEVRNSLLDDNVCLSEETFSFDELEKEGYEK